MVRQSPWPFRTAVLLSCGLYMCACAALAADSWQTSLGGGADHYQTYTGLNCLLFGWLCLFNAPTNLAWLANPLALVGAVLLLVRRPTGAARCGAVAFVLGLMYVFFPGGNPGHPDVPREGAWLWVGSLLALTIAALIRRGWLARKHAEPAAAPDPAA